MAKPVLSAEAVRELAKIARVHLQIETLDERKLDRLDFHSVAVWNVSAALKAAYLAGMVDHHRRRG